MAQIVLTSCLLMVLAGGAGLGSDGYLAHFWIMGCFAVTVVAPIALRRYASERMEPGPWRDRLQGLASVAFGSFLCLVAIFSYAFLYLFTSHMLS